MGSPHVQPKIYEFLKANAGVQMTASEIAKGIGERKGHSSLATSIRNLADKHPAVLKCVRSEGKAKRLISIGYFQLNTRAARPELPPLPDRILAAQAAGVAAQVTKIGNTSDVLITVPIGDNQSATLTMLQARHVYAQLAAVFGPATGGRETK